jgi:hypothetical protein
VKGGLTVNSTARMLSTAPVALVQVLVSITGSISPAVSALLPLIVRDFSSWNAWGRPGPPSNPAEYAVTLVPAPSAAGGFVALSADRLSAAVTAAGVWTDLPGAATVTWSVDTQLAGGMVAAVNFSAAPVSGASFISIGFVVVMDTNASRAAEVATATAADFPAAWAQAQQSWEDTWTAVFTPNNTVFAGHLPTVTVR